MKKQTIILVIISIIIVLLVKNKEENIIIPDEAIRIRIISNSNDSIDIENKKIIQKNIEKEIYKLLKDVNDISKAREIINNNLDRLNIVLDETTKNYSISFGSNYFPRKTYKGIIYDEGIYESLVITLGNGNGNNWWCVLFPPLCLLEENENTEDVEYKFFVKELINKYFKKSN